MGYVRILVFICICIFSVSCVNRFVGKTWPEKYYKMINSRFLILKMVFICFFMVSCSNHYVAKIPKEGKPWAEYGQKRNIDSKLKGLHKLEYDNMVLTYSYSVNPDHTEITLCGEIEYRQEMKYPNEVEFEFDIIFYLIDKNNIVRKIENKSIQSEITDVNKYPFNLSIPFNENYFSISCSVDHYVVAFENNERIFLPSTVHGIL